MQPKDLKNITIQAEKILRNIENQIALFQSKRSPNELMSKKTLNFTSLQKVVDTKFTPERRLSSQKITPRLSYTVRPVSVNLRQIPKSFQLTNRAEQSEPQQENLYDTGVSMNQFKLETILGHGSYAVVRSTVCKVTKQKYAIKIYEKIKLTDPTRMTNLRREILILKEINHPNIIKLHYAIEDKKSINLVMEYVSSQSLASYWKSRPNRLVDHIQALEIIHQLAQALQYLHSRNIAHRDIKMENILLDPERRVKLIDFGFAIKVSLGKKLNIFCGTPSYMSPEIVSKTPHSPPTSDIWSLGILLSTLVTGQHPFKGQNDRELYRNIQQAKWKSPAGIKVHDDAIRIINKCLDKSHLSRCDINQLLDDNYFKR